MDNKGIFLFENEANADKHTLITGKENDNQERYEAMVDSNQAVKIDLGNYGTARRKASQIHDRFDKDVARIREDDNPALTDAVKAYEIAKLEAKYVEDSEALQEEYSSWRRQQIEKSKSRVAKAMTKVSEDDRQLAEQFAARSALKLEMAESPGVGLMQVKDDIALLSDSQKVALQPSILSLIANVDASPSDKKMILTEAEDVRNPDLLSLKIAEQLPSNPAIEFSRRRAINKVNFNSFV